MEQLLLEILAILRSGKSLDSRELGKLIDSHNALVKSAQRAYSKKKILPYYLRVKEQDPARWASWGVDDELEARLMRTLRMKPRRTASGVATITVITKPWKCSSDCLYCPNDLRMPKSYLHAEPACQRAERNFFDPYLQVASRLRALEQMGHLCDKVELIVLGGTWSDYPISYQTWFVFELFRALNDAPHTDESVRERRGFYRGRGISCDEAELAGFVELEQKRIAAGEERFNAAFERLYGNSKAWAEVASAQEATLAELFEQHRINETAAHRVVGLVIETRPDAITPGRLRFFRQLGCTKVQIGVQSLRPEVLRANERRIDVQQIARAFAYLRVFGFKIHAHFMVNLYGSTPDEDVEDYREFMSCPSFMPDEVKLYPCALIEDTRLVARYEAGQWRPYGEDELVDVLVQDILETPPFCRVSRMIRDFSAGDIVAGNKKTNLRQMVEAKLAQKGAHVDEIRYREISLAATDPASLELQQVEYETSATREVFLQWVTPEGGIAGFLRLSLPDASFVRAHKDELPVSPGEAMIREVHVYGRVANFHESAEGVQHRGLGKRLVERAADIARARGYAKLNVISSVGTRGYYEKLGFKRAWLYQARDL